MEFSFTDIIDLVADSLNIIFHGNVPEPLLIAAAWVIVCLVTLLVIYIFLLLVSKIYKLFINEIIPIFYNESTKLRRMRRQRFAEQMEHEIRRLNRMEAWSDYRFTEVEAEVEAEGRQGKRLLFFSKRDSLRREKSLSKALQRSDERLILLEGEPGSGKSVALRHVALNMARKSSGDKSVKSIIPIYVNLKTFEMPESITQVDRNLIKSFILATINRANDRDIEAFLEDEFDYGLHQRTWLFLFDSFDEIPAILSATEANEMIRIYAEAINDFLQGMNRCRGIIASREYRGPRQLGWPKFRILSLSEKRQRLLVKRADLRNIDSSVLIGELSNASIGIRSMASNPMFLSLLCDYAQKQKEFPKNSYSVYEEYINNRLQKDALRLQRRFNLSSSEVRDAAERVAFCMSAEKDLGLSPTRSALYSATINQNLSLGNKFNILLDCLEFLKLARSEVESTAGESRNFTFAHRRFQEYFATSVVLRDPHRVTSRELLMNGKWRETAVVLLQTQSSTVTKPLITESINILQEQTSALSNLESIVQVKKDTILCERFSWPNGMLHLMSLLQEGFTGKSQDIPVAVKRLVEEILSHVMRTGTRLDKKWAIEVSGIAPQLVLLDILRQSFESNSRLLTNVAYRQVERLYQFAMEIVH